MKRSIYSQNSLLRISLLSALTLTASFTTHAQDKPVAGCADGRSGQRYPDY